MQKKIIKWVKTNEKIAKKRKKWGKLTHKLNGKGKKILKNIMTNKKQ